MPAGYAVPKQFRLQNDPLWGPLFVPIAIRHRMPDNRSSPGGSASDIRSGDAAQAKYLPSGVGAGFQPGAGSGCTAPCMCLSATDRAWGGTLGGQRPDLLDAPLQYRPYLDELEHDGPRQSDHGGVARQGVRICRPGRQGSERGREGLHQHQEMQLPIRSVDRAALVAASDIRRLRGGCGIFGSRGRGGKNIRWAHRARATQQFAQPFSPPDRRWPGPRRAPRRFPPACGAAGRPPALSRPQQYQVQYPAGDVYRVYLDLPEGASSDDPVNSSYVGSFNFFDAVPHGDQHADHAWKPFSFDITNVASNLEARGRMKDGHTVTIVPAGARGRCKARRRRHLVCRAIAGRLSSNS